VANAFNESLTLWVNSLGPESAKQLAAVAHSTERDILAAQQARRGLTPGERKIVDGQEGKPFEQVRPDGTIFIGFDYRAEIVKACFEALKPRSPVVSGDYIKGHFCILDGKGLGPLEVPTAEQLVSVKEIIVTNPMPYSRKLEVGKRRDGSPFVRQVDPHIFEFASVQVNREFGKVAAIYFNFVDLEGAYTLKFDQKARRFNGRVMINERGKIRKDRKAGSAIRYPGIYIERI